MKILLIAMILLSSCGNQMKRGWNDERLEDEKAKLMMDCTESFAYCDKRAQCLVDHVASRYNYNFVDSNRPALEMYLFKTQVVNECIDASIEHHNAVYPDKKLSKENISE